MSVLKVWNKRNRRKSVSSLLIVLMLLSMLPTGVLPAQVVSASINPAAAEYDLAASADVSTTITWNDAASVVSVVYDGTPLAEVVYSVIYFDSTTSTLTIRNDFFKGLVPAVAAGNQMPFTVNFNAGEPLAFTVTVINSTLLVVTGAIAGQVTGPDGVGVPNVSISVRNQATGAWAGWAQTDTNGNYTIAGLASGTYEIEVRPSQGVNLVPTRITGKVVAAGVTTTVDVSLEVGGIISGTVTGSDGAGVPNAGVDVRSQSTGAWAGWAQTDANGNYTIAGLASGAYDVRVSPPWGVNLAPVRIAGIVVTAGATATVDVSLEVGGIIAGRVTDPDGNGVPNASIDVWVPATGASRWAQTDANGNFIIAGLASGTYDVRVSPPQGVNLVPVRIAGIVVTAGATATVDVPLEVGGIIAGRVTDPDGNGVPNASIDARVQATGASRWAQTDASGNYTIAGLAPGTYDVRVSPRQGVNLIPVRITGKVVTAGVTTTVDVSLEAGGIIAGKVTDPDGVGVSNASVEVRVHATGAWAASASADADGNFIIAGLASGTYDVRVSPPQGVNLAPVRIAGIMVTAGATATVDVPMEVGGIIAGRVTDPDGNGVPNASIDVWVPATGASAGWVQTDANGNFIIAGLASGTYDVRVSPPQGVNLVPVRIAGIVVTAGATATVDVPMEVGGIIAGRVTDPDGNGVPNASIDVWVPATGASAGWVQTDANGNFTIAGLATGTYDVRVSPSQGVNLVPVRIAGIVVTAGATATVDVPLEVGGTIAGRVTDPDGNGVPNASIDARVQATGASHQAQTDANGNFTIAGLASGTYDVRVSPRQGVNLIPVRITGKVVTAGVTTTVDVSLEAGGIIAGRVTDPDGNGVPNASIDVWVPATGASAGWVQTDANGNFTIAGLATGTYDVRVSPSQGVNLVPVRIAGIVVTAGATATVDVPLEVGGLISGRVTGSDGAGVPNASIYARVQATGASRWAQTDANGNYTITGLASGIYEMRVSPPQGVNLVPVRITGIVVTAGATATVDVPLEVGGLISGRVTGSDGAGVPNASIYARVQATGASRWAQTDANGNYTITGLASGIYEMRVSPPQGVNLAQARITSILVTAGVTTTVDVTLEVGGIISGKVTGPDGAGVPNASISVWAQATGTWVHGLQTDANGNYITFGLAPGTYEIEVRPPQGVNLVPVRITGVVTAGVTTTVDVSLEAGGIIAGKVTDPDGNGVPNASVDVWVQATGASRWAQTDANGNYTIAGLASGSYEIEVRPTQGVNLVPVRITGIVVTAGVTTTVDVSLEAGGIIAGKVTDPDGVGVSNAIVEVRIPATGAWAGWAQTDANGNYTTTGLTPGTYEIVVRPSQGVNLIPARISGIEVTAGVTTIRNVVLVAGGLISGRVTDPDGAGVPNVSISVRNQATGASGWAQTDANGNYTTTGLAPGTYDMSVWPSQGVNLLPARISGIEVTAGATAIRDVTLVAGGLISGKVTGPDGAGVPNVSISVRNQATGASGWAQTDANGNYTTTGLAPGTYDMSVWPSQGVNLLPARITSIEVTAGATAIRDVTLVAGGLISGRVTGPDGTGVQNANVSAWDPATGASGWVQTDAEGNYSITGLAPGIYDMSVSAPHGVNLVPASITSIVVVAGENTTVDVLLEVGGIISGRVTDPDASGVPNASIFVWDQFTGAWVGGAQTDVNGNYTIAGLAPGTYDIGVRPSQGVNLVPIRISGIVVTAGQETVLEPIELFPHGAISGTVTDGAYGVSGATVEVAWKDIYGDWLIYGRALTGTDGGFTLSDIPPGTYDMRVTPPPGELYLQPTVVNEVTVTSGVTTELLAPIVFLFGGAITGRVTGPDGVGVPNARISVWDQATGDWVSRAQSNAEGDYNITGLVAGTYEMSVAPPRGTYLAHAHITDIEVTAEITTMVNVTMEAGGIIAGRVTDPAGNGVTNANVEVRVQATGAWVGWAKTSGDGSYTTTGLAPGTYEMWVMPLGYLSDARLMDIVVTAGATTTVDVSLTAVVPLPPVVNVTGVTVSPPAATINVGATEQLAAAVAPAEATNQDVTWASSNTAVATVSDTGLVTGVEVGSATITVTTADGGFTVSSLITVVPHIAGIAETGISQSLDDNGIVVLPVKVVRVKDPTGTTVDMPGGLGDFEATVTSPDGGIQLLAVRGTDYFPEVAFAPVTGEIAASVAPLPRQPENTEVARLVPRLTGSAENSYTLTVAFQEIVAAETGVNVLEEQTNSLTFRRGDANGDDRVNIVDAMFVAQKVVGNRGLDTVNALNAASVRHDGPNGDSISIVDAMFIAQYVVGLRDASYNLAQ